jgi:hypothetical protein
VKPNLFLDNLILLILYRAHQFGEFCDEAAQQRSGLVVIVLRQCFRGLFAKFLFEREQGFFIVFKYDTAFGALRSGAWDGMAAFGAGGRLVGNGSTSSKDSYLGGCLKV